MQVVHIDNPFKIQDMPLKDVYVLDNWLSTELHQHFDKLISNNSWWSKTNQVGSKSPTGLPHHSFWGASFFRDNYEIEHDMKSLDTYFVKSIIERLEVEFGFKYTRFQYAGLNSQTQGCPGTIHSDCSPDDAWNISFLYYPNRFWNPNWGGVLRFFDEPHQGLDGRQEHIEEHQVAEVEFVPNRLVMFDGRIPHGADSPNQSARYMDRKSLVVRGDEVELVKNTEVLYKGYRRPITEYAYGTKLKPYF